MVNKDLQLTPRWKRPCRKSEFVLGIWCQ